MVDLSIFGSLKGTIKTLEDASFLTGTMQASGVQIVGALRNAYPPSKSGPGRYSRINHRPMGYYQRSLGWWYPVMQKQTLLKGGRIRTAQRMRGPGQVAGYRLAKGGTSQRLKEQWSFRTEDNGLSIVVTNPVTYGKYAMGDKTQAALMAALDWPTVRKVVAQEWPNIVRAARAGMKARLANRGT